MSQLEVDKIIPQSGTTLTIGDSGDTVNFADGTNLSIDTNTLYIDSTNNRVGIANSSPSVALDVTGDAKVSGDLTVDTSTLHVDSTNNRVGIGTSSPGRILQVSSTDPQISLLSTDTSGGSSAVHFGDSDDDNIGQVNYQHSDNSMRLTTNASEAMRIDSSGNVGIGTTTPVTPLQVNRDISGVTDALSLRANSNVTNEYIGLNFAKATHGRMSGIYGRNENNGNADGRLYFYTNSGGTYSTKLGITSTGIIFPGSDNTQDLGTSGSRFNDIYLGGGLYVGGTGTANKLDDYEEGTFTPTVTGATSGSFTTGDSATTGSYVKIGNQVTVRGEIHITGSSSPVGAVRVGNLPFTCAALTELSERTPGSCWVKYMDLESTTRSLAVFISQLNSYFQFYETNDNANVTAINSAEVTVPGAEFAFSLTYQTS